VIFRNSILDKFISGWYVSGVFRANSGLPLGVIGGDFGGGPFANTVNMINLNAGGLDNGVQSNVCGTAGPGGQTFGSASAGGAACLPANAPAGTPAPTGTGLNIFKDPGAVASQFRYPNISSDGRDGSGHPVRGLGLWNLDSRLGKVTSFHERFKVEFSADFFNIFNHVNFFDPSLNINTPANFGVINTELVPANRTQGSRWIELGLRASF
jgi:hypothetical protein